MTDQNCIEGSIAALCEDDIDTDAIIPARFLLYPHRQGLKDFLFCDRRAAQPDATFVLDQPDFREAPFLLAGRNFGCGSSREHAVWALMDHGIRCIFAPGFGDIFANNAARCGLLTIVVDPDLFNDLSNASRDLSSLRLDVAAGQLHMMNRILPVQIDERARRQILDGLDEIDDLIQTYGSSITDFEQRRATQREWSLLNEETVADRLGLK